MSISSETADKKIHPVETQWHYNILTKHGFTPSTKEATGLVRSYIYTHLNGYKITAATGYHRDHWVDNLSGDHGLHFSLEEHLEKYVKIEKEKHLNLLRNHIMFLVGATTNSDNVLVRTASDFVKNNINLLDGELK